MRAGQALNRRTRPTVGGSRLRLLAAGGWLRGRCGGGRRPRPAHAPRPPSSPTVEPTPAVAAEHAVDPPGKRKDPLAPADMLVFSPEPARRGHGARHRATCEHVAGATCSPWARR